MILAIGGALVAAVLALVLAVDRFGRRDQARAAPAIVVLGARVLPGGVASGALRARAEKAAELYRAGLAPLVVFSGGAPEDGVTEAAAAREIAVRLGVPASACLLEEQSRNTAENARLSAALLRGRGIGEVVLVTDPYHLLRARQHFRLVGLKVHPSPASLEGREVDRWLWLLREALGIVRSPSLWFA